MHFAGTAALASLYFRPVERQLKERLIGAAVLIAVAVALVPEMFSGSASRVASSEQNLDITTETDSSASSGQLKTFHIQLQDRVAAAPQAEAPDSNTATSGSSASTAKSAAAESASEASLAVNTPAVNTAASSARSLLIPSAAKAPQAAAATGKPPSVAETNAWVVQIGSFGSDLKAKRIVVDLKAKNYPAYSGTVTANGKPLFRVRVGPIADRTSADSVLKRLKGEFPDASVMPQGR